MSDELNEEDFEDPQPEEDVNQSPESDLPGDQAEGHVDHGESSDDSVEEGTEAELEAEDESGIHQPMVNAENGRESADDIDSEAEGYAMEEVESEQMQVLCSNPPPSNSINVALEEEESSAEGDADAAARAEGHEPVDLSLGENPETCTVEQDMFDPAFKTEVDASQNCVANGNFSEDLECDREIVTNSDENGLIESQDSPGKNVLVDNIEHDPSSRQNNIVIEDELDLQVAVPLNDSSASNSSHRPKLKDTKGTSQESYEPECDQESDDIKSVPHSVNAEGKSSANEQQFVNKDSRPPSNGNGNQIPDNSRLPSRDNGNEITDGSRLPSRDNDSEITDNSGLPSSDSGSKIPDAKEDNSVNPIATSSQTSATTPMCSNSPNDIPPEEGNKESCQAVGDKSNSPVTLSNLPNADVVSRGIQQDSNTCSLPHADFVSGGIQQDSNTCSFKANCDSNQSESCEKRKHSNSIEDDLLDELESELTNISLTPTQTNSIKQQSIPPATLDLKQTSCESNQNGIDLHCEMGDCTTNNTHSSSSVSVIHSVEKGQCSKDLRSEVSTNSVITSALQVDEEDCVSNSFKLADIDHNNRLVEQLKSLQNQLQKANITMHQQTAEIHCLAKDKEDGDSQLKTVIKERDSYIWELNKSKNTEDLFLPQIKELEFTIAQQQSEIKGLKEKLTSHDTAAKRAIGTLQNEMKSRVDQVTKMFEDANKDKADMVVKYAQAERHNMERQKALERLDSKFRDVTKERDNFHAQIKDLKMDKKKQRAAYDSKDSELNSAHKEIEKLKDAINSGEVRVKWAQNKLKAELDAHKETKTQVEKTMHKLKEAKEETEQIRRDCQAIVKTYQESEEIKSNSLDHKLKVTETEMMQQKQEKQDQDEVFKATSSALEQLKKKHGEALSELQTYRDRAECLSTEQVQNEQTMNKFRDMLQKLKTDNKSLQERIEELLSVQKDFKRAQVTIKSLDAEISDLKISNKDLVIDMEACRKRESEKLELTEKLSCKNAGLQSENTTLHDKCMNLTSLAESQNLQLQNLESDHKQLLHKYNEEHTVRGQQEFVLSGELQEARKNVQELMAKVDDGKDEIKTLKRKHGNNIKDLTRQLQQTKRKLETLSECNGDKDTTSMGSRTSSSGSLNTAGLSDNNSIVSSNVYQHNHMTRHTSPPEQEFPVIIEQVEPNPQVLIERIVKLQRGHARKNEKIEFMEDHISQLIDEIKKKNKIIQSYFLREESGTMTPEAMDLNKSQFQKKHSIMGSLYNSHSTDGTMTLDLSLEINKKIQAVLEDTLLKNITLKESIDTLGEEIARLSKENRQMQLSMTKNKR